MRNVERCGGCGKFTMVGIDNGSALLFAHQWCKCLKEREDAVSDNHVSACSSLTTDGMLQRLDEMLWNHEEPYLEEIPMGKLPEMEDDISGQNARDTQFKYFAECVVEELASECLIDFENYFRAEQHIARRAYDLVCHTLEYAEPIAFDRLSIGEHVERIIPDMTELPKEQNNG